MVAMKKQCYTLQIYEQSTHIPRGLAAYLARSLQTEGSLFIPRRWRIPQPLVTGLDVAHSITLCPQSWGCSRWPVDDFPVAGLVRTHALDSALLTQCFEVALNGAGGLIKQAGYFLC